MYHNNYHNTNHNTNHNISSYHHYNHNLEKQSTTPPVVTNEEPASRWQMWAESIDNDKDSTSPTLNTKTSPTRSIANLHSLTIRHQQQHRVSSPHYYQQQKHSTTPVNNSHSHFQYNNNNQQQRSFSPSSPRMTIEEANRLEQKKRLNQQPLLNEEQVEFLSTDPPLCFCKKPAHRSFSLEYGPVLECNNYNSSSSMEDQHEEHSTMKNKYTCGFHVHEISWNKFRQNIKSGQIVTSDYTELRACPLYNFTYCTMFYLTNNYVKVPPTTLPDCFCGKSVKLLEIKLNNNINKIYFTCQNGNVEGAKKCSWKLEAKEVAFPRPKYRLHTFVDLETYQQYRSENNNSHAKVVDMVVKGKEQASSVLLKEEEKEKEKEKEGVTAIFKTVDKPQHQCDLLATLIAHHPTPTKQQDFIDFEKLQIHAKRQEEEEEKKLSSVHSSRSLVVPTSVLAKKQQQVQQVQPNLSLSCSSSVSTTSSSTSSSCSSTTTTTPVNNASTNSKEKFEDDLEELRILNSALQAKMKQDKKETDLRLEQLLSKLAKSQEKLATVQSNCQDQLKKMRNELEEETLLRLSSQERLSSIELDVVNLMNDKEKVTEELANFKEMTRTKYGKEDEHNKCKVCFHRSIEFVLIPCYHYAYCQLCASKLKECAICRMSITSIQKIYNC